MKKDTYVAQSHADPHTSPLTTSHIPNIKNYSTIRGDRTTLRRQFMVAAAACHWHNANDVALAAPIRQGMHLRFPGLATIVPAATVSDSILCV